MFVPGIAVPSTLLEFAASADNASGSALLSAPYLYKHIYSMYVCMYVYRLDSVYNNSDEDIR